LIAFIVDGLIKKAIVGMAVAGLIDLR